LSRGCGQQSLGRMGSSVGKSTKLKEGSEEGKRRGTTADPVAVRDLFQEVKRMFMCCEETIPLPTVLVALVMEYLHFDIFLWDPKGMGAGVILSNGGRTAGSDETVGMKWRTVAGSRLWYSGQHYFEVSIESLPTKQHVSFKPQITLGFVPEAVTQYVTNVYAVPGFTVPGYVFPLGTSQFIVGQRSVVSLKLENFDHLQVGARYGIYFDLETELVEFSLNGRHLFTCRGLADVPLPIRAVASFTDIGTELSLHFRNI